MKYLVEMFWSDDDEGYNAVVPDLPGCSAFSTTLEAAVRQIADAIEAWIAACRASGDPPRTDDQGPPSGLTAGEMSIVSPDRPTQSGGLPSPSRLAAQLVMGPASTIRLAAE
jgi:predicted RNase H-like HicB family nuclease